MKNPTRLQVVQYFVILLEPSEFTTAKRQECPRAAHREDVTCFVGVNKQNPAVVETSRPLEGIGIGVNGTNERARTVEPLPILYIRGPSVSSPLKRSHV
jgi:hypothetical protein